MGTNRKNTNYEFVNIIKGIAIILVILLHTTSGFNLKLGSIILLGQGVPLFLLITSFLYFKKRDSNNFNYDYRKSDLLKIFKRIFIPYFIFQLLILIVEYTKFGGIDVKHYIKGGGIGMGSYYPWLYVQYWLLLPIFDFLIKRKNFKIFHFIVISCLVEILYNLIILIPILSDNSNSLWRLFVGRYIFIIYLGYLIAQNKFELKKFYLFIILGLLVAIAQRYHLLESTILFFQSSALAWNGVHWPMYFYSTFFLIFIKNNYDKLHAKFKKAIIWLGIYSWDIFLSQMLYFQIFNIEQFNIIPSYIRYPLYAIFSILTIVCITLGYSAIKNLINSMYLRLRKS